MLLVREARVACATALATLLLQTLCVPHTVLGQALGYLLLNGVLKLALKRDDFEVAVRSAFLGMICTLGGSLVWSAAPQFKSFGIYLCLLAVFHFSEFVAIAVCNPKSLSTDSFVINHSWQYSIAAVSSWAEFFVESHFFPQMKEFKLPWMVGGMVCVAGEVLRKLAMVTASSNFTHLVQFNRNSGHRLVTHGIFSVMRHPSYVGWFWWSIGTQVLLANPVCVVLYALASWMFFRERVYVEECTLINFFGHEYMKYKRTVPSGLPLIDGYVLEEAVQGGQGDEADEEEASKDHQD